MSTIDPRADAKLQNLPEEALQDLWRFRHPEEGGEKLTLEAICVEVQRLYRFSISLSSLHGFYRWLEVKRRIDQREDLVNQVKQRLAENPEVSDAQIKMAGQRIFMAEGIIEKDAKIFADMVKIGQADAKGRREDAKLELQRKGLKLDEQKFALMERKAKAMDEAAEQMKLLKAGGKLMPDAERTAILDKMDEILGLKK